MASERKRSDRRRRHEIRARGRGEGSTQQQFATAGEDRDRAPDASDPSRDPKTLNDFDPAYGHTHGIAEQRKGGEETVDKETYGRGGGGRSDPETSPDRAGAGGGPTGYGETYGQGFGVGAGHGVESEASGLEGNPRQRDYRGNAGVTFGATVGPDALREDTSKDKRPDPKPTDNA